MAVFVSKEEKSPFKIPTRAIFTQADLKEFQASQTSKDLLNFIKVCNDKVKGLSCDATNFPISETTEKVVAMLDLFSTWVDEIPPLQQPMRFGNKAFRDWHTRLTNEAPRLMMDILPEHHHPASIEIIPYLSTSFGNEIRIDYGTGHETNFVIFLYCLSRLRLFTVDDLTAVVLKCFTAYMKVMRRLQSVYLLEPAGSHGVWGLDDYHCLPFYWGASQLMVSRDAKSSSNDSDNICNFSTPESIHDNQILDKYSENYLYFGCIQFIKKLKHTAPFAESSPMLNDISALPNWNKVNSGMLRLYEAEVLGKLPVIQHLYFGSLLPCTWACSHPDPLTAGPVRNNETRAPWATNSSDNINNNNSRNSVPPVTRAPWATNSGDGSSNVLNQPTRAPWADKK